MHPTAQRLRERKLALFFVLAASLSCVSSSCVADTPADLVIANARIVVGTGAVIDRGTIVVRDGRIEAVDASEGVPSAARVIDAGGATVLPGLIDVHRHFLPYSGATSARIRSIQSSTSP